MGVDLLTAESEIENKNARTRPTNTAGDMKFGRKEIWLNTAAVHYGLIQILHYEMHCNFFIHI